jgi:hypothetical protein
MTVVDDPDDDNNRNVGSTFPRGYALSTLDMRFHFPHFHAVLSFSLSVYVWAPWKERRGTEVRRSRLKIDPFHVLN